MGCLFYAHYNCPSRESIEQRKNPTNHWICRVLRFFIANCRSFFAERKGNESSPLYPVNIRRLSM
jgi:hypothetical protein